MLEEPVEAEECSLQCMLVTIIGTCKRVLKMKQTF